MKRVLYVLRYFPTLSETFVYREIAELMARGVKVEIRALGERADGVIQDQLPDVPTHRPVHGIRGSLRRAFRRTRGVRPLGPWARCRLDRKSCARIELFSARLHRRNFDRVHAHFAGEAAEWASALAEQWNVPFSVTVHANDLFRPRISFSDLLERAEPVICISSRHQDLIWRSFGVRAQLVRCGVPDAFYTTRPQRNRDDFHVISVGRWVEKKGLDTVLEAVSMLPESVHLTLASNVPERFVGNRVTAGFRAPSELPELMARADVFALPCRLAADGDRDGIPVALLEAMASGLPVITTGVSGISEVVDEEVGWLVPPENPLALRYALEQAMQEPRVRWDKGDAARARMQKRRYTVEAQVTGLLSCWGWS